MAERGSEELNIRLAVGRRGDARSGALGARLSKAIGGARLGAGVSFRGGGVSGARGGFSSDRRQRARCNGADGKRPWCWDRMGRDQSLEHG